MNESVETALDRKYANVNLADIADTYGVQARIDSMLENEFILANARYNDSGLPKPYNPATDTVRSKPAEKLAGSKGGGDKGGLPQATPAMVDAMIRQQEAIAALGLGECSPSLFEYDADQYHDDMIAGMMSIGDSPFVFSAPEYDNS